MSTITALPTPPSRSNPVDFSERTDAFLGALPTFVTEVNLVAGEVESNATTASAAAATATEKADIATNAADDAAATAGVVKWVSGTTYDQGVTVWSPADFQTYRRSVAGAGTTDPSNDTTNWQMISGKAIVPMVARSSNTQLTAADRGKLFDCTGTWSQAFAACSTLAANWWCYLRNSGTGIITLDPDGSETVDGTATVAISRGEMVLITCSGSALSTFAIGGCGDHEVTVHTGNGHGSTNTKIRRFTTTLRNVGSAITYADSAANGASFTINKGGLYELFYADGASSSTGWFGATVNSSQLTTAINSITDMSVRAMLCFTSQVEADRPFSVTRTVRLLANDVVRPHTNGNANLGAMAMFSIRRIGE